MLVIECNQNITYGQWFQYGNVKNGQKFPIRLPVDIISFRDYSINSHGPILDNYEVIFK